MRSDERWLACLDRAITVHGVRPDDVSPDDLAAVLVSTAQLFYRALLRKDIT